MKYHNKKLKEIAKQIEEQGATVVTIEVLKTYESEAGITIKASNDEKICSCCL
jgi:uncharacterized protein (DUF39 family)